MGPASLGGSYKRGKVLTPWALPYWQGELLGQEESFRASGTAQQIVYGCRDTGKPAQMSVLPPARPRRGGVPTSVDGG